MVSLRAKQDTPGGARISVLLKHKTGAISTIRSDGNSPVVRRQLVVGSEEHLLEIHAQGFRAFGRQGVDEGGQTQTCESSVGAMACPRFGWHLGRSVRLQVVPRPRVPFLKKAYLPIGQAGFVTYNFAWTGDRRRSCAAGGKSGHHRTWWWVTPTGPLVAGQGKCHRKQTAPGWSGGKGERVR